MVIREGARGEPVVDIQARLVALGYEIPGEERTGSFGPATTAVVRSFQQDRGLLVDGVVGKDTWRQLVEASWRLGDRVLYLRAPHLRGDDVRELQDRLSTFGFDAGRADGIFGPATARAVNEFQRNYGLPPDGIVAERTLRSLNGLPRIAGDTSVMTVREREAMRARAVGLAGMRIVLDAGHGGEDEGAGGSEAAICSAVVGHVAAALGAGGAQVYPTRRGDDGPDDDARAALANTLEAELFLSVHACGESPGGQTFYFGHARYRSEQGMRLAKLLVEELEAVGVPSAGAQPKTFSLLRETSMPAVFCQIGSLDSGDEKTRLEDPAEQVRMAAAIVAAIGRFAREPAAV